MGPWENQPQNAGLYALFSPAEGRWGGGPSIASQHPNMQIRNETGADPPRCFLRNETTEAPEKRACGVPVLRGDEPCDRSCLFVVDPLSPLCQFSLLGGGGD